ncbi:amino acid adenylation domain-containing protein [Streptomyces sp. XM4193]|uniref:non-ribosomal peptide synthetase n=1 Tax=Streptomyces sp. XM4193 TaxID=2929782 RepID=UPI001FF75BCB|nr:non-ribosomal peptide synthetase [Streptomyces sp. XM4193]MCK1798056.1 amino acid adenylation domain-containing protein [Streptomyces sp. XM4193]
MTGSSARSGLQDILPLSPLQQGLFFLSSYDGSGPDVYQVQLAFDLDGPLDDERMRRAGAALLRRHPNLMAAFRQRKNGEPVTLIPHEAELPWEEADLSGHPEAERERRLERLLEADRHTRFDLAVPPLLRFTRIRLAADRHRLLLTHHHLLLDGWSTARVVQELFTLYAADGGADGLPQVRPYRDYLAWAAGRDAAADEAAWTAALANLDGPTLAAPSLDSRSASAPRAREVELPDGVGAALAARARELDLTAPLVVQTLWSLVLAELTGRRDVVSGTTVSGRPPELPGAEHMVGLFINTLPVRVRLRPAETLAGLLRRTADEQAVLLPHHHLALARIQQLADAGSPLFDTLCVFENYLVEQTGSTAEEFGGVRVRGLTGQDATHYPLTLVAAPAPDGGVALRLSHRTDAFDDTAAARIADRMRRAVELFVADPHRTLAATALLDEEERSTVLEEFNSDTADTEPATLGALFEAQAARHAELTAVEDGAARLTYAGLNSRANALAHQLIAHGVGPEDIVAVALPRGAQLHIAQLAVAKAGGVYAPLDPGHPDERLSALVRGAGVAVVLSDSSVDTGGWAGGRPVVLADRLPAGLPDHNPADADRRAPLLPDHAAYLIHTSGSTGTPKGVLVAHRPLADLVAWAGAAFGAAPGDRVTQFASPSFDVTLAELANSLLCGATLVVVPEERRAGEPLADFLVEASISFGIIPPSVVASLPEDAALPEGMTLIVGTEALPPELIRAWAGRHRLFNAYGPTEAVVNSATWRVPASWTGGPVPIGPPDVNKRAYVLDAFLRPLAPGALGELYVGGPGLARGYLGLPGTTAERFVADPFAGAGARMYRTGDLARWNAAGELEYAGRVDHQLKIRGFRVEPAEVEARLTAHPALSRAVVTDHRDERGTRRLVAHVVAADGAQRPAEQEIAAWVAAALPDHMVPSAVIVLDALPLTRANKIDRAALPAPRFDTEGERAAPETDTEKELAELVASVLGLPDVGVTDSFFALGGDSISSIQLVGAARRRGLLLHPRDVFEHRTVRALAALARPASAGAADAGPVSGSAPLTPILRSLVERGGPIADFHQSTVLHTPAGLRAEQLVAGLQQVLDHHDGLRARLTDRALEIPAPGTVAAHDLLTRVDGLTTEAGELLATLRGHAVDAARRLDPTGGTMLRAVWLDAGPDRPGLLALLIHHAVVDGVSWRVLTSDLAEACEAARAGRAAPLQPVGTTLIAWARSLGRAAAERPGESEEWAARLTGADDRLAEPLDPARDTLATLETVSVTLDPATTGPLLGALPERFHAGPDDVLLTALAMAVATWRGHRDPVLVDLEGHGRREELVPGAELSRTVGWFTSVHPVRLDLGGHETADGTEAGAALKRIKEQLRAPRDGGLGHGLLRHLNEETRTAMAALPQPEIGYNYLGRFPAAQETDAAPVPWSAALSGSLGGGADDALPAHHTLQLDVSAVDGAEGPVLHAGFTFAGRLLGRQEVQRLSELWLDALRTLRRGLAGDPASAGTAEHTPSDFPLTTISQAEIETLERRGPLADVLPLSPLQEGMFFLAGLGSEGLGPDVYTTQTVLEIDGELHTERLRRAADRLTERHPNLKAAFHARRGADPLQVIHAETAVPLVEHELSAEPEPVARERARALLEQDRALGFDLAEPPALRLTVVRLGGGRLLLAVTAHHILLDGWSGPLLVRDLMALYQGGSAAGTPRPYRDYLRWLAGRDRQETRNLWQRQLAAVDGPTRLVPQAAGMPAGVPERVEIELPRELEAALFALARREQTTVGAVVQAAWGTLLGLLTGRTDVTFGVTVSGRPADLDGSQEMIGLFINTVPARVRLRPEQTAAELVREVAADQVRLLDHGYEPLAELQRLAGHRELFDTLVLFENFPVDAEDLRRTEERAGLRVVGAEGHDATHYPLVLVALPGRERLALALDHRPELVDTAGATAVGDQLRAVLRQMTEAPHAGLRSLVPLDGGRPSLEGPRGRVTPLGVTARFLRQAEATPLATALVAGDQEWTYARLAARTTELADRLAGAGAGEGTLIAVLLPRTADLVAALLAVGATGAGYLPVDPEFPAERIAHLLADADPHLVLDSDSPLLAESADSAESAESPEGAESAAADPAERPHGVGDRLPQVRPHGTAYVIHTSGSTGRPKGVVVTHENLANLLDSMADRLSAGPADRLLAVTTISFDIAALELYTPLVTGGTVILADREQARDPLLLAELAERTGATHLQATPSLWRGILETAPHTVTGLRVLSGGEPLPADLADQLARHGTELHNLYGPTETTVWSTAAVLPEGTDPHVGTALANTVLRVLDGWLRPVPAGTAGELYIGGAGVALGYLGRHALTAERFVADPYGPPGARLYRTGDLARSRPDGTLDVLGRVDHQLKVRGHRVEPGEIEAVLRSLPGVADAVVVGRADRPGDTGGATRLVGYVTGESAGDTAALRSALADRLPEYLVPSVLMPLPALPLTPNGKVDRAALPDPTTTAGRVRSARDPREAVLGELFADVLGVDRAGPDDDFFTMGGHSLLAMRLANRLRSTLGIEVALRDVFDHPTPAALAAAVLPREAVRAPLEGRERTPGERLPLSYAQSRLWFLHRLDGPSATYNLFVVLRLGGDLDIDALRAAIGDVVVRHESLRTVYPDTEGLPYQEVLSEEAAREAADFRPVAVAEADLESALRAHVTSAIDIVREIPLRPRLLRTESDHVLALTLHHIAGDEWSMRPLTEDLRTAYTARLHGAAPQWRPLPVGYPDYAVWQREVLGDESDPDSPVSRQAAYWKRRLAGSPEELALPYDRPRPAEELHEGATVTFAVEPRVHRELRRLAAETGTSVFMAAQAGLAVLLAAHGAGTDLPIGTPVAGRTDAQLDELVGFFVNTLVLRTDVSGEPTFRELLARVREVDLAAFDHADLPFEQLVEEIAPERTLARNPLFQVLLVFQNVSEEELTLPGLTVTPVGADPGTAKLDLLLTLAELPGGRGINGMLTFQTSIFDTATAQALADRYARLLAALADRPDVPFHRAPVLTRAERARVLAAGTGERRALPGPTLPALLAQRAAPEEAGAPAVLDGERTLSRAEFEERVGRVAALLRRRGVGPETRVAVALPRSAELVVALHAVHRAGGAYVPVDLGHPAERIAHVLADSAPQVLLTDRATGAGLPPSDGVLPLVLDDPAVLRELAEAEPVGVHPRLAPANAAYVLYTSGSTGRPKGVVVDHAALLNRIAWMAAEHPLTAEDRVLQKTPVGFDVSVWEFFLPAFTGAALVVLPDGHHTDPALVAAAVRRHGVTVVHFVPSMLGAFAAHPEVRQLPDGAGESAADTLRLVFSSGEALGAATAAATRRALPGAELHNLYGPTEAAVDVTAHRVTGADEGSVPIGAPVPNTGAHVLDRWLRPVPDCVTGELCLSGVQLARGYHARAALTAERFVAHPFGEPGERLYRTGDLVRRRPDGTLLFVGRADGQVKLRGLRVELGEIEAVLGEQPEIAAAAVVLREDEPGRQLLAGYLVPAAGVEPPAHRELAERLGRRLPEHMVPGTLTTLDALPLTPSGKLDRAALPAPDLASAATGVAPRGIREATLVQLFAELLGVPEAGAQDSFFALGGDSILSIQLVARARRAGMVLTPRDVFERRTPAALADAAGTVADTDEVPAVPATGRLPLTPIMRWALARGPIDGLHQSLHLVTPADATLQSLTAALERLLDRHPVLRARLVGEEGRQALEIPEPGTVRAADVLTRADLSGAAEEEVPELTAAHAAEAVDALDPAAGRMVRALWSDRGAGRPGRLLLVVHHLAVDGVSWRIIGADLAAAHHEVLTGAQAAPAASGTSFRQWALGLADAAREPGRRAEDALWREREERHRQAPPLGVRPLDTAVDTGDTVVHLERTLDAGTTRALLTEVPASVHGSVHEVLLAGAALAFGAWRAERGEEPGTDVIAAEGHGREEDVVRGARLDGTVGWFTSWYPVVLETAGRDPRALLAPGSDARPVLMALKEQLRAASDNGIGYGLLRGFGEESEDAGRFRTPEAVFNYLGRFTGSAGVGAPAGGQRDADPHTPAAWTPAPEALPRLRTTRNRLPVLFPLEIIASTVDGPEGRPVLATRWSCATGVLPEADADRLLELWFRALTVLADGSRQAAEPVHTPSDFPLVRLDQRDVDSVQLRRPSLSDVWPLTPLQEGLYALTRLAGDELDVYTMQLVLRLAGSVDASALHGAARELLVRNPGLRTAFVPTADGSAVVQVVVEGVEPDWAVTDLTDPQEPGGAADPQTAATASGAREEALRALADADRQRPFELSEPPLLRLRLVRLGAQEHALILTNHHAVLDGWSVPVLVQELFGLYAAGTGAAEPPAPRRSFRDFLAWRERQYALAPDAADRAWAEALEGVAEPTLIAPGRTDRTPALSHRAPLLLEEELREAVQELARATDVTVNTVVQFAWALLLSRQTGREDVVFGATVSGRPPELPGVETMTGLFVNTLPVRVDLRGGGTVRQALRALQDAQSRLSAHQHHGLADIQRMVGAGELFDTLVVFENYYVDSRGLREAEHSGGLAVVGGSHQDATHYPLTLTVVPGGHFTLEYLPSLFDRDGAQALLDRLATLLASLTARPDAPVHRMEALPAPERERLLEQWSGTRVAHPRDTLPELFAGRLAADPSAPAVVCGERELTFAELGARAARLAHELIARGTGPEDVVALLLPRTEEMLVAQLAVLQAGAAYLPLDPEYPAERLEFMLADSSPRLLLTTGSLSGRAGATEELALDDPATRTALDRRPAIAPTDGERLRPLHPDHPAYLIYTSGSTGRPKGVVATHRGIANLFHSHRRALYEPVVERTGRRRLQVGHAWSFSFDASWQPQLWLYHGHCVHVLSENVQRDPGALLEYLRTRAIDFIEVAPSVLAELETLGLTEDGSCPVPLLGVGGEAVPDAQWARLKQLRDTEVVNLYGPTECTVDSLAAWVADSERQVIGSPVDNARVRLLDAALRPVPPGVPGEMYLSGPGLARGYLGRPTLTAERFVADPFAPDGGRLYRTGDLARWTADGAVEFLGRVDDQVKIRGFRVELGEIETAAAAHPEVGRAVVVAREDGGVRRLVGYVEPRPGAEPQPASIRAHLAERLPAYLVPAAVVVLPALPLTANAKLDRDRLPPPDFGAAAGGREPSGERERAVCEAMAAALSLERFGADDDFFALGGDSLVSVRLVTRLRAGGWRLSPRDVFTHPTPVALAQRLEPHENGPADGRMSAGG